MLSANEKGEKHAANDNINDLSLQFLENFF